jgi:DNA-directed RNA polymerase subunit RPC12/RpoP
MATHSFKCNPCSFTFSFESEEADVQKFRKEMNGIKCPKCGKVWGEPGANITHEFNPPTMTPTRDLEKLRKANRDASGEAAIMASKYASANPIKTEVISRPEGMKTSRFGNSSEVVPSSVMESLKNKAIPK